MTKDKALRALYSRIVHAAETGNVEEVKAMSSALRKIGEAEHILMSARRLGEMLDNMQMEINNENIFVSDESIN